VSYPFFTHEALETLLDASETHDLVVLEIDEFRDLCLQALAAIGSERAGFPLISEAELGHELTRAQGESEVGLRARLLRRLAEQAMWVLAE
jgi:hypothetical protein